MKYCECGCGKEVNKRRRFILGHHSKCMSDESKRKISKALKGIKRKPFTEEHKKKIKMARSKQIYSTETKRKISISNKGKICSAEKRIKISKALKGRKFSEEWKRKLSIAHRGKKLSREQVEKIRNANRGKKRTEEQKRKMSEILLEDYATRRRNTLIFKDTSIEIAIEKQIKNTGIVYEKQKCIKKVGIVDFFLPDYNIIVECDGDYWHNLDGAKEKDINRDFIALFLYGYKTIRFWEHEIKESPEKCKIRILKFLR